MAGVRLIDGVATRTDDDASERSVDGGEVRLRVTHVLVDEADRVPGTDRWLGAGCVGEVAEVGDDVDQELVGTDVLVSGPAPCRSCGTCRRGQPHLCRRPRRSGPATRGIGGARASLVVAAERVTIVPSGSGIAAAAVLGGAGLSGAAAIRSAARLVPGERIAVVGDLAAMAAVAVAVAAGARTVIGCPLDARDGDAVREFGAHVVAPVDQLVDAAAGATDGLGTDASVLFGGDAGLVADAIAATRPGGTVVVVDPHGPVQVPLGAGRTLVDAPLGGADADRDLPWLVGLLLDRGVDLGALVATGEPGLDGVLAAIDRRDGPARTVHALS